MNKLHAAIVSALILGSLGYANGNDKINDVMENLKQEINQEKMQNGANPADDYIFEDTSSIQNNTPTQQQDTGFMQNQPMPAQNQTPSVTNDPNSTNPVRTKKDYANMPIPVGAKLITMRTELVLPITQEKYTVIEFPFEIRAEFGEFEAMLSQEEADSLATASNSQNAAEQRQPISITQKENKLIINSSITGKAEAIIWGGPYPVVVNIVVNSKKNKNSSVGYYVIREQDVYVRNGSNIKRLENNSHEKVLSIVTAAMYKDKKPKGYELKNIKKTYKYKDLGITLIHVYTLEGDHYLGEKWEIMNDDKKKSLNLYEEMFYAPNIYSISFLANPIEPKKSTSMYIVRKNENSKRQ
ncbi:MULTISPECIES: type-F conjugative transfer system secretin TraK [unclassified Helicobacter]|uniref:TraK domain-containing protein n=1 Tax=unclassified Helicobacter TaxID=2593540 RepID=UPI0015F1B8F9|nr:MULTISPECIES: type-F conjugative transfer system secretin TraK [unclassified Helicobacter]